MGILMKITVGELIGHDGCFVFSFVELAHIRGTAVPVRPTPPAK